MNWKSRGPDRRRTPRFEIVGRLAGAMTVAADVELCNVSQCGALIVAPGPLVVDSRCTLRVDSDEPLELESRVRRVVARTPDDGYHIGLEFLLDDEHKMEHAMRVLDKNWADGATTRPPGPRPLPQGDTDADVRQFPGEPSHDAMDRDDVG